MTREQAEAALAEGEGGEVTVLQIMERWLVANGYDGLCSEDCGCFLSDLMPCESVIRECVPGHKCFATEEDTEYMDVEVGDPMIKEDEA